MTLAISFCDKKNINSVVKEHKKYSRCMQRSQKKKLNAKGMLHKNGLARKVFTGAIDDLASDEQA